MYKIIPLLISILLLLFSFCYSQENDNNATEKNDAKKIEKKAEASTDKTSVKTSTKEIEASVDKNAKKNPEKKVSTSADKTPQAAAEKKAVVITMDDLKSVSNDSTKNRLEKILSALKDLNEYYIKNGANSIEYVEKYVEYANLMGEAKKNPEELEKIIKPGVLSSGVPPPEPPPPDKIKEYQKIVQEKDIQKQNKQNEILQMKQNRVRQDELDRVLEEIEKQKGEGMAPLTGKDGQPLKREDEISTLKSMLKSINKEIEKLDNEFSQDPEKIERTRSLKESREKIENRLEELDHNL